LRFNLLHSNSGLVSRLLGFDEMKASKLLALLAFAGLCGTAETDARSHKFEIKHLEKQRAERIEEHREARERINELNSQINLGVAIKAGTTSGATTFVMAETDGEAPGTSEYDTVSAHENWMFEQEIPNLNWQVSDSELIRQRELEELRMRETAREIARIDKAIRKQKARERHA
jgi:hypothetical protein